MLLLHGSKSCAQSVGVGCGDIAQRSRHRRYEDVHVGLRCLCVFVLHPEVSFNVGIWPQIALFIEHKVDTFYQSRWYAQVY